MGSSARRSSRIKRSTTIESPARIALRALSPCGDGLSRGFSPHRAARALLGLALGLGLALWATPSAGAAAPGGLVVIPHPISATGLSYFKLSAAPGSVRRAGTIELHNPTGRRLRVVLSAVNGETLSTLGSGYAPPGSARRGSARWLALGTRTVSLEAGASFSVPVEVTVPASSPPGDYLSGVSIEALDQHAQGLAKRGVSIASVDRYAIGVEVSLPGPRTPSIRFTGAVISRQPAGLTFQLLARNAGNVILQGVHGRVRISSGGHTVLSRTIEAGTFITNTSIAYPVTAYGQLPSEGTQYGVAAWLRYRGGIARLNTTLTFGHREAAEQGRYTNNAKSTGSGAAWWEILGVLAVILYAILTTFLLLRRRKSERERERHEFARR